ncbi:alpha-L-glutamate ligase-like protein [Mesobaculum littorinae]|uniref:Alpha-L-glutamate ligase-like protein n=1 Tax=Mesobaculum littorinae TaxID=2486419 RepID=A0A438AG74_9RHOB|nr:alpha-L-glutamate ligase-like protein [Mesobaculum littorinae]RVV97702.1 alpha-L-glutamate ligase-like protein [Mesobaculum littorinae]
MLTTPWALKRRGVLGINARNTRYVADGNPRHLMPQVNNKIATKRLAAKAGVPTPELYGVIEIQAQVRRLDRMLEGREDFVIKPACGAQGDGILVISGRNKKGRRLAGGGVIGEPQLAHFISNVLSGMYSLNGLQDQAMLEEKVDFADVFEGLAEAGVPDVRIIVYRGVPAMAMARIPTRESGGKANLHKGGIGLGIAMDSGRTTRGVYHNRIIDEHPESGQPLSGIQLPDWHKIVEMSARCYDPTGLDYLGVDIVFDEERGPLLLELNARPGLAVQLSNGEGLDTRLRRIAAWVDERPRDTEERIAFGMTLSAPVP